MDSQTAEILHESDANLHALQSDVKRLLGPRPAFAVVKGTEPKPLTPQFLLAGLVNGSITRKTPIYRPGLDKLWTPVDKTSLVLILDRLDEMKLRERALARRVAAGADPGQAQLELAFMSPQGRPAITLSVHGPSRTVRYRLFRDPFIHEISEQEILTWTPRPDMRLALQTWSNSEPERLQLPPEFQQLGLQYPEQLDEAMNTGFAAYSAAEVQVLGDLMKQYSLPLSARAAQRVEHDQRDKLAHQHPDYLGDREHP